MCIAILKPQGKSLSRELLYNCYTNNPDGCGFAYHTGENVVINKFMNFEDFYREYVKYDSKYTMLIHFRIATHGAIELDNCHPFVLNHRMALVHNGVITGYGDKSTKSDTKDFIEKVIGNISWKMWKNKSFCELVGNAIGYSKFAILDKTGGYVIINESKGLWEDGVWFSNSSFKTTAKKYTYGKQTYLIDNKKNEAKEIDEKDYQAYYDDLWDNLQFIYKCGDCGKEWYDDGDSWSIECSSCKSRNCYEAGYVRNGKEHRYATPLEIGKKYSCC